MATVTSAESQASPGVVWALIVVGTAVAIGWVFAGQEIGAKLTIEAIGAAMSAYYAILFVPLIVLALLFGWIGKQRVLRLGEAPGHWAVLGLVLGAAGFLVTVGYSWLNGGLVRGEMPQGSGGLLTLGAVLTLLQVGTEELLFRGWLQPALVGRLGTVAGVAVGAVIFAAFHIPAGAVSPISLGNLMLGGLFFGLLALRSGGLVAPLMAHYAWNAIEDMGFGLVPNPSNGPLGSFSDWDLVGRSIWGGTAEGLNDSIGTAIVLAALILPLAFRRTAATSPAVAAIPR